MAFIVWRLSRRDITPTSPYRSFYLQQSLLWLSQGVGGFHHPSSQLPALSTLIFVFPRSGLSSNSFFHLYNLVIFIENNCKGCVGLRIIEDVLRHSVGKHLHLSQSVFEGVICWHDIFLTLR